MATTASSVLRSPAPGSSPTTTVGKSSQMKVGNSANNNNNSRRSAQSPVDGQQRRNSQKGWQANSAQQQQKYGGSGVPTSSSPTPSQAAAMKSRTTNSTQGGESDTHDKHMHDRTLFLLTKLMGREVTVTVKSGAQYIGVLTGVDAKQDISVVLKQAKLLRADPSDSEEKAKEGEYVGGGADKVMIFEAKDFVDLAANAVPFEPEVTAAGPQQNGNSSGFKTDADISGNASHRERDLQRWQPDEAVDIGGGLEDSSSGAGQSWNQFEANERLFGLKSDYDENIYTTTLDRSHPDFNRRSAAAAKIVAELEGQSSAGLSAHIAEERGLTVDDSGMDEEDKYSGVQRAAPTQTTNTNRYTPPARRAPSGNPTVAGAPHDPAIIASALVRPETLQQRQPALQPAHQAQAAQQPAPQSAPAAQQTAQAVPQPAAAAAQPTQPVVKSDDNTNSTTKLKERLGLPEIISPSRGLQAGTTNVPKTDATDVTSSFRIFVAEEKNRVQKRRVAMAHRDRETKLKELKKFSESFSLKTAVPQDLVPILTKDKAKQAEILEKAKQASLKSGGPVSSASTPAAVASGVNSTSSSASKVLPVNSFAARDPERFKRETSALLQNFPKITVSPQPGGSMSQNVRRAQQDKNMPTRAPMPVPEQPRQQFPAPTGPASAAGAPKRFNVNARPFEFKPNPSAAAFTPTFGGPSTNATPSPTVSVPQTVASRAPSPSLFFGGARRVKSDKQIKDAFNPFKRMKKNPTPPKPGAPPPQTFGNANDYIDKPWFTLPTWGGEDVNKDKSYKAMFVVKTEFEMNSAPHPAPPHMMPPQPHHPQMQPHMPHMAHPPHVPHQPHHGPMQPHIIAPHYDQEAHLRQMSNPSSVMPSPSLNNATVAQYQQSPVPHPSQLAMFPGQQGAMGQYPGPQGPQYGYYNQAGFRGPAGAPMMMHGPHGPVPYQPGQVPGQFVQHYMPAPQQPHPYMNNGQAPPNTQGFQSSPRPAPMMMHQNSSQGAPGGPQMMPYGMQPGQGGPMYGAAGQQQSELFQPGPSWLPQRSQSTIPFPVSSPRARYNPLATQPPAAAPPATAAPVNMMRGPSVGPPPHQGGYPPHGHYGGPQHYPRNQPYPQPMHGMPPQQQQMPPPPPPQQQAPPQQQQEEEQK
ncbi:Similar to PAB1-binding protein 1; acc. no. P53297 [Pyronema omphalodes CBS 100304]|uniref:Similar to PAB1-binding protein 1 acc. no. P53297 n=1 Tax=Pyronema omphalodes (strain CBS 100304) TaxID=1076935 RepID=U4L9R2_PYROM|nr:Similar to PAB1-binding protein 1; acc. no. P53297 [Pyronema omphalodes CBS 100304]